MDRRERERKEQVRTALATIRMFLHILEQVRGLRNESCFES